MMMTYRPHIDGLRAVAVLLVVLYHMNSAIFSGGYIGVDIFFVISGFVITQSLYKEYLARGRVNIFLFYLRRFKRLYPALITMLTGTTVAYFFFGFLWDTNLYLKSALSALFASSNLYFLYHGDNYFQQDLINPLIHTWSLGVEEQFYLLYPLLLSLGLMVLHRLGWSIKVLAAITLFVSVLLYVMFAYNLNGFLSDFYSPLARFWELGIGCTLFLLVESGIGNRFAATISLLGIAVLVSLQLFPSINGVIPIATALAVFATVGIIYAGLEEGSIITRFLSRPLVVYIGKLSYSLYLWHLPVIYFAFLYVTPELFVVIVPALSVFFAMASYHLVENPLRNSNILNVILTRGLRLLPIIVIVSVLSVGVVGLQQIRTVINNGFNDFSKYVRGINYIESRFALAGRMQPNYFDTGNEATDCGIPPEYLLREKIVGTNSTCIKLSATPNQPLFYLFGDSHARQLVPALYTSNEVHNLLFKGGSSVAFVTNDDQNISGDTLSQLIDTEVKEVEMLSTKFPKIYYIISMYLSPYQSHVDIIERNLRRYIEAIGKNATIIFIAPTPVFPGGPESCVLLNKHCEISKQADQENQQIISELLKKMDREYDEVYVFDPYSVICPNKNCLNYDARTDTIINLDDDHITVEESVRIAPTFDAWLQNSFGLIK